jgi:ATP-dependent RNA helicase DeaD
VTTSAPPAGFASLGLQPKLADAVAALGYEEPTPIQRETIPLLLEGRDVLGQAGTGTGKTAAFALPMLQRIFEDHSSSRKTHGLVLVPTRELAMQVAEAIHKYAKGVGLSVLPLYGGAPMHQQVRALERGAHIVVATPGRALDHMRRKTLKLDALKVLILDEADEMLDMGFAEDLDAILKETPTTRQTALFSATMPARILSIAQRHLRTPTRVTIEREKAAAGKMPRVRQVAYIVNRAHKAATLARILDMEDPVATLVFCRTRMEVETLVETFNAHGQRAEALHGGMEQRQRDRVMGLFRAQKADLLIATDVAARGLDIEHLSHVVNYDVPASAEVYLHRIGRTGRAGRGGTAITLAETREHRLLRVIENFTRSKIEVATVPTVADLRARRLDVTKASLRETLLAGELDPMRVVVQSLAEEFDIVDIAAAAVKMAHAASAGDGGDREIPVAAPPRHDERPRGARSRSAGPSGERFERPRGERFGRDERPPAKGARFSQGRRIAEGATAGPHRSAESASRGASLSGERSVRLFIGAGRQAGIRPGDLVGAITGEAGVESRSLGAIEITDRFSLIDVPEALADDIIAALKATTIRGAKVQVRRDRASA